MFLASCQIIPKQTNEVLSRAEQAVQVAGEREWEKSRVLTAATIDTLESAPEELQSPFSNIALEFSKQNQTLIGPPIRKMDVQPFIARELSGVERDAEENRREFKRIAEEIATLREEKRRLEEELALIKSGLVQKGLEYEREKRENWFSNFRKNMFSGFRIIIIVAVLILLGPLLLPLFGQVLAMIVGSIPSIAGFIGVVGKNTFDSVVLGVENVRSGLKKDPPNKTYSSKEVLEIINTELGIKTDKCDKKIIERRKEALNLV